MDFLWAGFTQKVIKVLGKIKTYFFSGMLFTVNFSLFSLRS